MLYFHGLYIEGEGWETKYTEAMIKVQTQSYRAPLSLICSKIFIENIWPTESYQTRSLPRPGIAIQARHTAQKTALKTNF